MTEISMDKQYQTRDGRDVRILCTDGPDHRYPVCGFIGPLFMMWTEDGRVTEGDPGEHPADLVEVPKEIEYECYVTICRTEDVFAYHVTRDRETAGREYKAIAVIEVKGTCPEGDGLDG